LKAQNQPGPEIQLFQMFFLFLPKALTLLKIAGFLPYSGKPKQMLRKSLLPERPAAEDTAWR